MSFLQTAPGDEPILVEGVFDAPPDRVFNAWTEPSEVERWFGHPPGRLVAAEIDLRVGGSWRFLLSRSDVESDYFGGEYLHIVRGALLVFTWRHVTESSSGRREATPASQVTVTFEAEDGGRTRLHLRHEGIQSDDARRMVGGGWEAAIGGLAEWLRRNEVAPDVAG